MDADAFEKFKEDGIFNKETANSFRENILSKGNQQHPMELYKSFRGRSLVGDIKFPAALFTRPSNGLLSNIDWT